MTKQDFLNQARELALNYRPAPEVLNQIKNVEHLIVVGPSGVGKSSLIDKSGIQLVPSDTTRLPRPGEVHGKDMFFRNDYSKIIEELKNGEFVQVAVGPIGDFYATRAGSYPKKGLSAMPVTADAVPIFRDLGFKRTLTIFVVPPSFNEWMRRMGSHNLSREQLNKRLVEAGLSLKFALGDEQMHFILNDSLDKAVEQSIELLGGRADLRVEAKAKALAREIYAQLASL